MPYKDMKLKKIFMKNSALKRRGASKICSVCNIEKPEEEFLKKMWKDRPRLKNRRSSYCHPCRKIKMKDFQLLSKYKITRQVYDDMISAQEGRCAICHLLMDRVCVDHRWSDGVVRQLLCVQCNAMIGQAKEDIRILESAIEYLEKHNK